MFEEIDIEYWELVIEVGVVNFCWVCVFDIYVFFIEGLVDFVVISLQGLEVSFDVVVELFNKVKFYFQEKWEWGWNNSFEVWNGCLVMVGFLVFLFELISG